MARCMICGKEREASELSGRICRGCADEVRRDAAGGKLREKRSAERAIRGSGQQPPSEKKPR